MSTIYINICYGPIYHGVEHNTKGRKLKFVQIMNSEKTPHTSPLWASLFHVLWRRGTTRYWEYTVFINLCTALPDAAWTAGLVPGSLAGGHTNYMQHYKATISNAEGRAGGCDITRRSIVAGQTSVLNKGKLSCHESDIWKPDICHHEECHNCLFKIYHSEIISFCY